MATSKKDQKLARDLFKLSFDQGRLSSERVSAVLSYLESAKVDNTLAVLQSYRRLVSREIAQGQAVVEHAGNIAPEALDQVSAAMSRRYGRTVTWVSKPKPELLAGMRVRVGDDVYESSVSGQLAALAANA